MAGLIDVSAAPFASLDEALDAKTPVRVMVHLGTGAAAPPPMLWPLDHGEVLHPHAESVSPPDVVAYVLSDAALAGFGASPMLNGQYVVAPDLVPTYVSHAIAKDLDQDSWSSQVNTEAIEVETAFSLVHYNLIYGHWLLEMLPKLFIIRDLMARGIQGEIVLPLSTPDYVPVYIDLIAPGARIRRFDPRREHIHARRLICPGMFNAHYAFHPALSAELDALTVRAQAGVAVEQSTWRTRLGRRFGSRAADKSRLFVSRRHMPPSYRVLTNRGEIEAAARRLGLTIVSPEQMGIREQIQLFANAALIVGEFGSGMHNAMFAPRGAEVVCLNWISVVQSRLANLRGQSVGYILPRDGQPRTFHAGGAQNEFEIDVKLFEARVAALIKPAAS